MEKKRQKIAIVGELPTIFEAPHSPLWKSLAKHGVTRDSCFVTTLFKGGSRRIDFRSLYEDKKMTLPKIELQVAWDKLARQLKIFEGNVIVALGNEVLYALTGKRGIGNWRGSILDTEHGKVIPTYSPDILQRQFEFLPIFGFDVARIVEEAEYSEVIHPDYDLITNPTLAQLRSLSSEILDAEFLSFDIETIQHHIDCIGFSWRPDKALCIPLCHTSGEHIWNSLDEEEVWKLISTWMSNPRSKKIAQNATYDLTYLKRYGIETANLWLDTMNAHHVIYPEFPKALDFLVSIYTKFPYFKDKIGISRWEYNALDALTTYNCAMEIEKELLKFGSHDFYHKFVHKLIVPYLEVQNQGVKCDLKVKKSALADIDQEINHLKEQIEKIAGKPLNPNSPTQMKNYFYKEKGYHAYVNRRTGKPTCDEEALLRLQRKYNDPVIEPILKVRQQVKLGGFLKTKVDCDGRIRTAYIISGTKTGRLASREHVYGSGTNLQNIPKGIPRRMFVAEKGNVLIGADLSQAEARIVACLSRDPNLIELFSSKDRDIHSENAALIFGGKSSDYAKDSRERFIAKTTTHAANYDISYKSYSLNLGMPEKEGKRILDTYHNLYPGIRRWHRETVEQLGKNRTLITPLGRKRIFFQRWGDDLFKEAYNFIPQSTVADLINKGFLAFYHDPRTYGKAFIRLQVHDALYIECATELADEMMALLISHMEIPLEIGDYTITIPAEATVGTNWDSL